MLDVIMSSDHVQEFSGNHAVNFMLFDASSGKSTSATAMLDVDIEGVEEVAEQNN
jgi:hypothetical protein